MATPGQNQARTASAEVNVSMHRPEVAVISCGRNEAPSSPLTCRRRQAMIWWETGWERLGADLRRVELMDGPRIYKARGLTSAISG